MHCLDGAEVIHDYFTLAGLSLSHVEDSASIMVLMSFSSVLYRGFNFTEGLTLLTAPPVIIFNIKSVSMIVMLCLCYVC